MKKLIAAALLALLLAGCGKAETPAVTQPQTPEPAVTETKPEEKPEEKPETVKVDPLVKPPVVDGLTMTFGDKTFDLTDQGPVNAITDLYKIGDLFVLDGHINPQVGLYLFFDPAKEDFVNSMAGTNLVWRDEDPATCLCAFRDEIVDYAGETFAEVPMADGAFVYDMEYDGDELVVTLSDDGTVIFDQDGSVLRAFGPFEDILGLSGHYEETDWMGTWRVRQYLADVNDQQVQIAESFGEADDVPVEHAGGPALFCSCVYGGDGHQTCVVYRRSGDRIERGTIDPAKLGLTDWDDWGVNSTASFFDPDRGIVFRYARKDGSDGELIVEDFSPFVFEEYADLQ